MGRAEECLDSPSVDYVLQLTSELNQFAQADSCENISNRYSVRYDCATTSCTISGDGWWLCYRDTTGALLLTLLEWQNRGIN